MKTCFKKNYFSFKKPLNLGGKIGASLKNLKAQVEDKTKAVENIIEPYYTTMKMGTIYVRRA